MMPSILSCGNCGAANQSQAAYCRSCGHSLQAVKPTIYNSATGRLLANILLKQRYLIIASAGKGGMGAVYKVEDTQLGNRQVALKEMSQSGLNPQEQKEAADAFRQEALMLARLQHPNLPNIFDHFEENGRWYLVMSFIEGETLADYLSHAQSGKLPLDEALQIGMQLSTVLDYLHNRQPAVIFRDLKPANIMRMPDGHIYLIDFGIARHFKPGQAKDTAYYGSMGYAPPEQYGKAQTTPRSDIYSLGVVLYQLFSGHDPSTTPFRFPPLQSQITTIPAELATLITQMLELDEDKRPPSILSVKQKLQNIAVPPPPKVSPAGVPSVSPPNSNPPAPLPPTQPDIVSGTAPPLNKKVWSFGRRQLTASAIGAGLCAVVFYSVLFFLISAWPGLITAEIFIGLILVPLLFFGTVFGPWVGLVSAGIGSFVADFIANLTLYHGSIVWQFDLSLTFLGFFAGLVLLKTRGYYDKPGNIIMATVVGCLGAGIAQGLQWLFLGSVFLPSLLRIIPGLILLPVLLIIYNAVVKHRSHP
jgi:serine/threonine protein kinase